MNKEHILNEVRKTAENGVPLGNQRLEKETGIKKADWYGIYWNNRCELDEEAGLVSNKLQAAYSSEYLIRKLIDFIKEIRKFPIAPEFIMKRTNDNNFPDVTTFHNKLGKKHEKAKKVVEYCEKNNVHPDVIEICRPICKKVDTKNVNRLNDDVDSEKKSGHVYMLEHDGVYKIGSSIDAAQRHKKIATQMPFATKEIHVISTDDPSGIEAYWHKRFKDKKYKGKQKLQGEWFNLLASDIKAFRKRKKFM